MSEFLPLSPFFRKGTAFDLSYPNKQKLTIMIVAKTYPANRNLTNVFDELFNSFPATWGNTAASNSTTAPVNITELEAGYNLQFNVPGRNKEDFKINVDKGLLTVSYEKKEQTETKEAKSIRKEFAVQSFKRSFTLDEKVNAEGIEAKYENGILNVFLPKKEEVKIAPKQILIQ
jgi:HSP20 family protein